MILALGDANEVRDRVVVVQTEARLQAREKTSRELTSKSRWMDEFPNGKRQEAYRLAQRNCSRRTKESKNENLKRSVLAGTTRMLKQIFKGACMKMARKKSDQTSNNSRKTKEE